MNKLLFILMFIFGFQVLSAQDDFQMPTDVDFPTIKMTGVKTSDFIPANWKILDEAKGDLNGDGIEDAVLALKGTNPKFIYKSKIRNGDNFDTNPRMLVILFGTQTGYKLAQQSNNVLIIPEADSIDEPFDKVIIKNGVFEIRQYFHNQGSWFQTSYNYKFRYQKDEFVLIGADKMVIQGNTGEINTRSYNLLTKEVKVSKGTIENEIEKTFTRSFKLSKLPTLKVLPKAFELEIEKDFR